MTTKRIQQDALSDDIDLINLLEKIYLFFRRFKLIFIIAIIAGILLGSLGYFFSTKLYQSRIILHSSYLTNQEEIEIIGYWDQLLKRGEDVLVAKMLNISKDVISKVAGLDAAEIQKDYSSSNPNGYYVDVKVKDNSVLPELQNAIVHGLNNTPYAVRRLAARKEYLQNGINQLTDEANKLDSVRNNIGAIGSKRENTSLLLNVSDINKDLVDMHEKVENYKTELKFISTVQVLQGFIPSGIPVSRSLTVSIAVALIVCLAAAYIFSLIKYVEHRLKQKVRKDE
jgi:capsular polysaccharide biosynthesis protein